MNKEDSALFDAAEDDGQESSGDEKTLSIGNLPDSDVEMPSALTAPPVKASILKFSSLGEIDVLLLY
jgi:hypothetical protein